MARCKGKTTARKPCRNKAADNGYCGVHAPVGRSSKLTPEVQERICFALRAGNYAEVAVQHSEIGRSTYYQWLQRGAEESAAGESTDLTSHSGSRS